LCVAIIENLDHPFRVTFEECIVRRWFRQQTFPAPAHFILEIHPCLDFIESGKITLQLAIKAILELVAYSADARVTTNRDMTELILPQGAAWRATMRISIRDADVHGHASEFHRTPQQEVYLPAAIKIG
jgi:hypothetical protein